MPISPNTVAASFLQIYDMHRAAFQSIVVYDSLCEKITAVAEGRYMPASATIFLGKSHFMVEKKTNQ